MNGLERTRGIAGETELRTECRPVRGAIYVRIFNQRDRLALARVARAKQRVQVVYRRQIRRHHRIRSAKRTKRVVTLRLEHLVRRTRKIDCHRTRIDHVDLKSVRLEPACDRLEVLRRHAESLSEFLSAD